MKTLGLIPARSGSKGVPGKNFKDFCGKPLWVWAFDVAKETCNQVRISSDEQLDWDFAIRRPAELCGDDTPMLPVVRHTLRTFRLDWQPDAVVLLQPTQPLRTVDHVLAALEMLEETGADSVVSVVEGPPADWALVVNEDQKLLDWLDRVPPAPVIRRQDCRPSYWRDGTVYVTRRKVIEYGSLYGDDCRAIIIPASQSCNIDTQDDWNRAESMMRERLNAQE